MYNSKVNQPTLYLACAAFLTLSCNRAPENKEAVKRGVIEHLTKNSGLDLGSMNVEVTNVTFSGNEAIAAISFQPKGSPGQGMNMNYTLSVKAKSGPCRRRRAAAPFETPPPQVHCSWPSTS
ncbi:MAG: hypothetical protein WKF37_05865 [Bryobacteraceae bacterium]